MVDLLLKSGANPNLVSDESTALVNAVKSGEISLINLLINNGCDIILRDRSGRSALDYAQETGNTEIINRLRNAADSLLLLGLDRNHGKQPLSLI